MNQSKLFNVGVGVLELPPSVDRIEIKSFDNGYIIEFRTKAGDFVLNMKSNAMKPQVFMSLDSVRKRIIDLGWTSGFYVV